MPLPFTSMHKVPSTYSITNTPLINCFAITITVLSLVNILDKRSFSLSTNDCVLITSMKNNTRFLVTSQEGRSTDYYGELLCNLLLLTHVHRLNLTIISISPGWWNHLLREHHKVNGNNTWDFASKRTRLSWSGIHQRSPCWWMYMLRSMLSYKNAIFTLLYSMNTHLYSIYTWHPIYFIGQILSSYPLVM